MPDKQADSFEKARLLFDIAKTEYQREADRSRAVNDKAAKMTSFAGLLFTIFSFVVWRLLLDNKPSWQPWAEWAAYIISAVQLVLLLWTVVSLVSALGRTVLNHAALDGDSLAAYDEPQYGAVELYRAAVQAYWSAVSESRRRTDKQAAVLHHANKLIRLSYILMAVLVLVLFLLV